MEQVLEPTKKQGSGVGFYLGGIVLLVEVVRIFVSAEWVIEYKGMYLYGTQARLAAVCFGVIVLYGQYLHIAYQWKRSKVGGILLAVGLVTTTLVTALSVPHLKSGQLLLVGVMVNMLTFIPAAMMCSLGIGQYAVAEEESMADASSEHEEGD